MNSPVSTYMYVLVEGYCEQSCQYLHVRAGRGVL